MNFVNMTELKYIVKNALKEDIGSVDITTQALVPESKFVNAELIAKENCVICGLGVVSVVFKTYDKNIRFKPLVAEGSFVKNGKVIARIQGKAKSILTSERVALNFLSLLSGISTKTRKFVKTVKPCKVKILDTRKTIPGIRTLQKYAVRIGGGYNHRMKLDEMFLVKDNHLKIMGNFKTLAVLNKKIDAEIEVKSIKELKEAIKLKPDIIMLDNMNTANMKKAVQIRNSFSNKSGRKTPKLEASGGITLQNIKKIASCGVDMISVGGLTHSVKSVDISLEIL